jgi:hypothetical protein
MGGYSRASFCVSMNNAATTLPAGVRILEIGEFSLFKRNLPGQTILVFTGDNPDRLGGLDHRRFSPAMLPGLLRSLRRGDWDVVFCYPPARPLWDRRLGAPRATAGMLHRLARFHTLGVCVLKARFGSPLAVLDYDDETTIPAAALRLLDPCVAYFKRELPVDFAKAFRQSAPRYRTPGDVVTDPFFRRNAGKLRPLSASVAEDTARLALETSAAKTTDVFFAGSPSNSSVRVQGFAELAALAAQGYAIDVSPGGLSKTEYLARCSRAWLTWSPEGYGWECYRHYEASLCRSVPLLSQPTISRYRPLLDGVHALYYQPEAGSLREAIVAALADKAALAAMADAARAHALRFHTHLRSCEYILGTVLGEAARAPRT